MDTRCKGWLAQYDVRGFGKVEPIGPRFEKEKHTRIRGIFTKRFDDAAITAKTKKLNAIQSGTFLYKVKHVIPCDV